MLNGAVSKAVWAISRLESSFNPDTENFQYLYNIVRYGMVGYGTVWYGMVWYGQVEKCMRLSGFVQNAFESYVTNTL